MDRRSSRRRQPSCAARRRRQGWRPLFRTRTELRTCSPGRSWHRDPPPPADGTGGRYRRTPRPPRYDHRPGRVGSGHREEKGRFGRRHDAVDFRAVRERPQALLRIEVESAVRRHDERPDVEPRINPHRRSDDEGHGTGRRRLDERGQAWIVLRKGQLAGEIELIARQRQFRKDENSRALLRCGMNQSDVTLDVRVHVTADRYRLGGGNRTSVGHVRSIDAVARLRPGSSSKFLHAYRSGRLDSRGS